MILDMEQKVVPIDTLKPWDRNPREGDVGAISDSLDYHGQYRSITVNKGGDRTHMMVITGNHTMRAAQELGFDEIAATFIDVTDEEAERIMVADNRLNDLAGYDERTLADVLTHLAGEPAGLAGTGFSADDLDELIADLNTPLSFTPEPEVSRLDQLDPITCPNCGHQWQK